MPRLIKIFVFIVILTSLLFGQQSFTTGDLIIAPKDTGNWPPLVLERPDLLCTFDSDNFKIHYDTTGDYVIYHPHEDIDPADDVPDYINRIAEFLELSRYTYIELLGYDVPPPDEGFGGDDSYDIYVTNVAGLTVPEFQSDYYPDREAYASYIFIGRDLRCVHFPNDPIPMLKAVCSHEYFHAIQMAYRANTCDEEPWWYELSACWANEIVFDDLNIIYYYLEKYYNKIDYSIYMTGGAHMYGAWVFAEYLRQNYGPDIINKIFLKLIHLDYSIYAIESALLEEEVDFDREFAVFGCWNYFTNNNYRPGFFEESEQFPATVPVSASHSSYPTGWIDTPKAVENMGLAYICFESVGIFKKDLILEFLSDYNYPEEIAVAAVYLDRPVEIYTRSLSFNEQISMRINNFDECDKVILTITWPYQYSTESDSANYEYNAYLEDTQTNILTGNLLEPEKFILYDSYPNPFNSACDISFYWNSNSNDYKLDIYNINGRLVDRFDGVAVNGMNRITWKPMADIAAGAYYYNLIINNQQAKAKMVYLK